MRSAELRRGEAQASRSVRAGGPVPVRAALTGSIPRVVRSIVSVIESLDRSSDPPARKQSGLIDRLGKKFVGAGFDSFDAFLAGIERRHRNNRKNQVAGFSLSCGTLRTRSFPASRHRGEPSPADPSPLEHGFSSRRSGHDEIALDGRSIGQELTFLGVRRRQEI